ncbi:MAG: DUF1007 family protein [Arcobacteraceae bacterium]|jgi:ABC-type uncharacterized transport system substrate-binding protein|nr:DUF1007 family protein [Arcobacteraceae bacterium]
MIKKLLFFFLLTSTVFACTLCRLDIPNVHINTTITPQEKSTQCEITWFFDAKFVSSLKQYDINKNGTFDPNEQKEIVKSLLEYLERFNYLTQIA